MPIHNQVGTGKTFRYVVDDASGTRTLIVPPDELVHVGDPTPIVLDIEARTRTRMKDGGNPLRFSRLWHHFMDRRDPESGVSFAEYCERRHSDWIVVSAGAASSAARHDPWAPYMPASCFKDEFGIAPERFRAARRKGRLQFIKRHGEYRYSVPRAMDLWPRDVTYLPDGGPLQPA